MTEKKKKPVRVVRHLPEMPEGLSVREKLLYVRTPLTAAMLAELLGVSEKSVYRAARDGSLPSMPRIAGLRFDGVQIARLFPIEQKPGQRSSSAIRIADRKAIIKVFGSGPGWTVTYRRSPG